MSIDRDDTMDSVRADARRLLARAAAAESRVHHRLAYAIDDFFLPDDARLDDRLKAMLGATLTALVAFVEGDIRRHATRAMGANPAGQMVAQGMPVLDRLVEAGLLRDVDLLCDLIARIKLDLLAGLLPVNVPEETLGRSLVTQLAQSGDPAVGGATRALMAAEGRRQAFFDTNRLAQTDLPAELHHRLVWWVAAAIREQVGAATADRAIAEAALRALAGHDEGDRVESAAVRLASAIDALPAELPVLLIQAFADRRLALFVALLARALGADYAMVREIVVDSPGERLWIALRAADLDRFTIAQIGVMRSQLEPTAQVEAFADQIEAIVAITPEEARTALAALRLPPDFRAAINALERK